jgi:hypothetical protein
VRHEWVIPLLLAAFLAILLIYTLVSRRLERSVFTAPTVFTLAGMFTTPALEKILRETSNECQLPGAR